MGISIYFATFAWPPGFVGRKQGGAWGRTRVRPQAPFFLPTNPGGQANVAKVYGNAN